MVSYKKSASAPNARSILYSTSDITSVILKSDLPSKYLVVAYASYYGVYLESESIIKCQVSRTSSKIAANLSKEIMS
jgi:hypothetical protein